MSDKIYTKGIILSRTDYSETDRILTILTPEKGKLRLIARGVKKPTSKLAGGIELFSLVEIGYVIGRGELGTLVSSRLIKFYKNILSDIDKVQLMYLMLKTLDKVTEDNPGQEYYDFLLKIMSLANDKTINTDVLSLFFKAQLLKLSGHQPDLSNDADGEALSENSSYTFNIEAMHLVKAKSGLYGSRQIKFLRLLFSDSTKVFSVKDGLTQHKVINPLLDAMMKQSLSI